MKKFVAASIAVCVLAGCSGDDGQYKSIVQCSMSAEHLNRSEAWQVMQVYSEMVAATHHIEMSPSKTNQLRSVIESEWKLDSLTNEARTAKLESVFNSPTCKAMQL